MSFILNPYRFASGSPVDFAYAENLTQVDESAGTYTDVVSLTFTPAAATYLLIWQTNGNHSGTLGTQAQLLDGVSVVDSVPQASAESTPPDKHFLGGMLFITGTGASRTFKIQGRRGTSGTSSFTQSRITALKLGTDDVTVTSISEQSTTLGTLQDAATLNFTPPSSGDYYVLYCCKMTTTSGAVGMAFQFTDGVTTLGEHGLDPQVATTNYHACFGISKLTGASGAQTCKIKYRSVTAGTAVKIKDCHIIAIRADRFASSNFAILGADSTGNQTTYTTTVSQTFTPTANKYLTLFAATYKGSSASVSGYCQALDSAETLSEATYETAWNGNMFGHQVENYAASSRTQAIQRKNETAANATVRAGASILSISLAGLTG